MRRLVIISLVIFIVGLGLIIRLAYPQNAFSFDEIFSIHFAQHSFHDIWSLSQNETNPPLLYFLLAIWTRIFGIGEFAVRSLSAISGAIAILGMWALVKKCFGIRAGLYAAVILAVSPLWIFFSHEARMYSMLAAAFLWAAYFGWSYIDRGGWWRGTLYGFLLAITALLHFGAWPPIAITGIMLFFAAKKMGKKRMWGTFAAAVPAALVIVGVMVRLLADRGSGTTSFLNHWAFYFSEFKYFIPQLLTAGFVTTANMYWVVVVFFGGILIGSTILFLFRIGRLGNTRAISYIKDQAFERWWVICVLAIPIAFGALVHLQAIRFFVLSLLMLPILVAAASAHLRSRIGAFIFCACIALCTWFIIPTMQVTETIHWKKIVSYVEQQYTPGDTILVHVFNESLTYNWYATKTQADGFFPYHTGFTFADVIKYNPLPNVTPENVGTLAQYVAGKPKVFLIGTHGEDNNFWRGDLVLQWFRDHGWRQIASGHFSEAGPDIGTVRVLVPSSQP